MRKRIAPYKHKDGSNCWTKNCSRNNPRPPRIKPTFAGFSKYQTEQIGVSTEIAIADAFGVNVNPAYRKRGAEEIINNLTPILGKTIVKGKLPKPVAHIAEDQNPVDFLLEDGKTLSVKTNMRSSGLVSPQTIGQPSSKTFWEKFPELLSNKTDIAKMTYEQQTHLFKAAVLKNTQHMLTKYWENLFECDYLIYVKNIIDKQDEIVPNPSVRVFDKTHPPIFENDKISVTQTLKNWNESNTVKYDGITIGQWQVHGNRDTFKFRFDLNGLEKAGLLPPEIN